MFVAAIEGVVAGFGSVRIKDCEIRAVYVDPHYARQGVGAAILNKLEEFSWRKGVSELKLASSLPGTQFYEESGYRRGESFMHEFRDTGVSCECVWMFKTL